MDSKVKKPVFPGLPGQPKLQRTRTSDLLRTEILQVIREATELSNKLVPHAEEKSAESHSTGENSFDKSHSNSDEEDPKSESPINSSDEYDTDLDIDERNSTPFDKWGVRTYKRTCRKLGIAPIECVLRGLKTSHLAVTGRGLVKSETLSICNALLDNITVRYLHLEENGLGPVGGQYVALLLRENEYITSVSLANNGIGSAGLEAISKMMCENETIKGLNLSGNNIGNDDVIHILNILNNNKSMTNFNLSHNDLGDIAGSALGDAIADNEYVKILDLSWNKIRTGGGIAIANGLKENVALHSINLAYNGFGIQGAFAIADALEVNDTLADLDLTCNRIFDDGGLRIGMALDRNESLKYLKLTNNPMTTATALKILQVLKDNEFSALELLDMSNIHIYQQALDTVIDIRDMRPSFKFLYGGVVNSNTGFGADGGEFNNRNPLTILKEYIAKKNMRLVDLFKMLDKDGGGSISKDEFITGLQAIEVPLTENQLDRLIKMLDKDGDGEVDYAELVSGDKEHRRKMRMKMAAAKRMAQAAKLKKKEKLAAEKKKAEEAAQQFMRGIQQIKPEPATK